jgi:hypothetical protein
MATRVPGMTAANPPEAHQQPPPYPILINSLECIGGTGRIKTARGCFKGREEVLIKVNRYQSCFFEHDGLKVARTTCKISNSTANSAYESFAAPCLATTTRSTGKGHRSYERRKNSLSIRLTRLRATAPPILRLTVNPSLVGPEGLCITMTRK